jgi:low affinity Fe/Cu permease
MASSGNKQPINKISRLFNKFSTAVIHFTGKPIAFIIAFCIILSWWLLGPVFDYSDTWQLVINTSTTIITFLMVFVIQQSQNKDTMAMQLKLNELIASNMNASNRLVDIEDLTEDELIVLKRYYVKLAKLAEQEIELHTTHSIDEANAVHESKRKVEPKGAKKA